MKQCKECGEWLPESEYYKKGKYFDPYCKQCIRKKYKKNKDDRIRKQLDYYYKNKESISKKRKEKYRKNKEKQREYYREYYSNNKEKYNKNKNYKKERKKEDELFINEKLIRIKQNFKNF